MNCNHPEREGLTHSRRHSEEKSTGYKYSSRNDRFDNRKMMITRREKPSSATVREIEPQNNQVFQPKITFYSGTNEHVASDELYLTKEEEFTPVTMGLTNSTLLTDTKQGIAELDIRGSSTVFCRAYCI